LKYQRDKWYKIDILLDWNEQNEDKDDEIALFIDGVFVTKAPFYSLSRDKQMQCESKAVDTLMLYNLSPDTATAFRNIKLCKDLCDKDASFALPADHKLLTQRNEDDNSLVYQPSNPFSIFQNAVTSLLVTSVNVLLIICISTL